MKKKPSLRTRQQTAAAYIRVSTEEQAEYSPASQLERIREYAARHEMVLPERFIYTDEGLSGRTTAGRPAFNRMIGDAKSKPKPFDVILLWKFSRFARNREDAIVYKSMLRKQLGIEVVSVSEALGDDKMAVLIEAMIEAMDEYYSINLAEEVRRGMTEKVSRGEPVTIPPFGYLMRGKRLVPDPNTAPIVREIFVECLRERSPWDIARQLNARDIRTARGNLWESRAVAYILRNPVYAGRIRWNTAGKTGRDYKQPTLLVTEGRHMPLIDEATFRAAQEKLDEGKCRSGVRTSRCPADGDWLRGLVKCSYCGGTLVHSSGSGMQCSRYAHGQCGVSHFIQAKRLEEMVRATLEGLLRGMERPDLPTQFTKSAYAGEDIERLLAAENRRLTRAKAAYEAGIDTLEEYRESKRKITEEISRLQSAAMEDGGEDGHLSEEGRLEIMYRALVEHMVFRRDENAIDIYLK